MTQLELHIEPDWRERLERARLADLMTLLTAELGREVQRKAGREVRYLTLPGPGPGLYLKRLAAPPLRAQLADRARGERAGRGEREAREPERVIGAGLRASQPIAWGCVRRFGLAGDALLITEEVRGAPLAKALADAAPSTRRALLQGVGGLIGRMHAYEIFHEVRSKDVIACEDRGLALIDRDPKDALGALAAGSDGALLCLARCEYLRVRGGAKLSPAERVRVLRDYLDAARNPLSLRDALAIVARALEAEFAEHRANPALLAEFGPLEP